MNRRRSNKPSSRSSLPDSPPGQQSRTSRLRRSYRPSQQNQATFTGRIESPESQQSNFKSPTRVPRSRAGCGSLGEESPHNDSDFQHDIIWDATSPSPNRAGKRGHRQRGGLVDISEIVNRIAPKHGRPEVVEPTLQRWIGDSATIPCTPDVQAPRAKKKSPRSNGVDDLLKLARQFDLNLFHQSGSDEDEPQEVFGPGDAEVQSDELDFLFDGPTQHVSTTALSQPLTEPAEPAAPPSGPAISVAFEDDWGDDDFLNDSLVIEMTQNPLQQNFTAPKFCSTQKPLGSAVGPMNGSRSPAGTLRSDPTSSIRKDREESQQNWFSPVPIGSQWNQQTPCLSQQTSPVQTSSSSRTLQKPQALNRKPDKLLEDDELLAAVWSQAACSKPVQSEPSQSQSLWDDPADDDLLCEVCEDLENQIVAAEQIAAPSENHSTPPASASSTLANGTMVGVASTKIGAGPSAAGGPWLPRSIQRGPFTFKKPSVPVSMVTSQVAAPKCSAAEIELKKQQAMERRRQRLHAAAKSVTAAT